MVIKLKLPIKPFSINAMYYRDKRHKTSEFRDWEKSLIHILNYKSISDTIKPIRDTFDNKKHCFKVSLTAYYPYNKYFTKSGNMSSHVMDLSNWEKPLLDVLFLPKYNLEYPEGAPNMNCDDKYVKRLESEKSFHSGLDEFIEVIIELQEISRIPIPNFSKSE